MTPVQRLTICSSFFYPSTVNTQTKPGQAVDHEQKKAQVILHVSTIHQVYLFADQDKKKENLPQLGIEPSAIPWEGIMLPLHH